VLVNASPHFQLGGADEESSGEEQNRMITCQWSALGHPRWLRRRIDDSSLFPRIPGWPTSSFITKRRDGKSLLVEILPRVTKMP